MSGDNPRQQLERDDLEDYNDNQEVDNEEPEADDSVTDDDLDDSEFDDDASLDQLDALIADEPPEDDLASLSDDQGADIATEMVEKLDKLEQPGKSKSAQALEARRAIEACAEQRRIDRDLNYLDFELDD